MTRAMGGWPPPSVRRLLLVLVTLVQVACLGEEEPAAAAPPFELPNLAGEPVALSDFAGRTVVVDFWATWCAPCKHQIPILNQFHRRVASGEIVVLGVSVDAGGQEVVAPFAEEQGIEYEVLLGSESLARTYGIPGFPALVVVDARGKLDSMHLGVITLEDLTAAVEQARR
ncbi:TlpA family protein disulfide reductase [Myxococcota bacterium]|nr:TlpA family protein disulfide reductase [Myxococcota bacterium]